MSNVNTVILVDQDGNQFRASLDQANALRALASAIRAVSLKLLAIVLPLAIPSSPPLITM